METKFTKGKWVNVKLPKTNYYPERNEVQYNEDGECVAEFVANDYDALLISKAPEMFEMLELLSTDNNLDMDTLHDIRKLLKEATEL